ncbi:MAG: trypsin-like peptidase domain-containing protein [Flavobacteriales bacterium]
MKTNNFVNYLKNKAAMKNTLKNLSLALIGGVCAIGGYKYLEGNPKAYVIERPSEKELAPVHFTSAGPLPTSADFTKAAELSVNAVVHITTEFASPVQYYDPFYEYFFGQRQGGAPVQQASGSGVIVREDGYVVTNNHVIDKALKITVTLNNKKTYEGTLVGADPSTDLAVIKINSKNLQPVVFGNSDEVRVGEWVLAVGNPFNLTSTVTAGIVSAKGRSINILKGNSDKQIFPIESFIQTDAAVNPGNSGGALVNNLGQLVGINTAIASNTGSYAGYSFAVPVNIVKKVSDDLIESGVVQRAFLGVNIREIDQTLADELKLKENTGVYVSSVIESGAAEDAGVKNGDIVLSVGNVDINNGPELLEQIGKYRPGNKVELRIKRGKEELLVPVTLRNMEGNTKKVDKTVVDLKVSLGATFGKVEKDELKKLKISSGVKITSLSNGKLTEVGIRKGFIITKVDEQEVNSPEALIKLLETKKGGVLMEGVYPNGTRAYYGFGM